LDKANKFDIRNKHKWFSFINNSVILKYSLKIEKVLKAVKLQQHL